jgi:putative phosphoesterase
LIAIISDIHGNLPALESVLKDMEQYEITQIISLGDVSGYYPFINEVIELLKSNNVINLIGNHDRYIINNTKCSRSNSANLCLEYQKNVITKENKIWLSESINTYEYNDFSMVHGGWKDNEDEYIYKVNDSYFKDLEYKYFFCGHTHVAKHIILTSKKEFINVGSVGQPRDANHKASYCVFDDLKGSIELRRVVYDINIVATKMDKIGFDKYFYDNLYYGTRIGGSIDSIKYDNGLK